MKVRSVNGALTVTFTTASGRTPTVYSDSALTTTQALPATVADGATGTFYFASPGAYTMSVKTASGIQIAADLNTTRVINVDHGQTTAYDYDTRLVGKDASGDSGRHKTAGGAASPLSFLNVLDFGADNTGATDSTAAFTAATTTAQADLDLHIPAGVYKLTGLSWYTENTSIRGDGDVILDFSTMSSGYAITVVGTASGSTAAPRSMATHVFTGCQIVGPTADATTVDAFYFNAGLNLSQINFINCAVYGFRDQAYYDSNNWCIGWLNSTFGYFTRRSQAFISGVNAGEMYRFNNCTFYNGSNSGGTATAVYTDPTGNADIYFEGCSFDYNNVEFEHRGGTITLAGCHIENSSPGAMGKLFYDGSYRTNLVMLGGTINPTEVAHGRSSLFDCTGDGINVTFLGAKANVWDRGRIDVVNVLSGSPTGSWVGGFCDSSGQTATMPRPGGLFNRLSNPGIEKGTIDGWSKGGLVTYAASTVDKFSDPFSTSTYSVSITGVGTAGSSFFRQTLPCPGNVWVHASADMKNDGVSAGTVTVEVAFLDATLVGIGSATTITNNTLAPTGWTQSGIRLASPPGTAFVQYRIIPTNLNGVSYVDNCYLSILGTGGGAQLDFGTSSTTMAIGNDSRITQGVPAGRTVTAATTLVTGDDKVIYNSAGAVSQALPTASTMTAWRRYTLTNIGAGTVTVTTTVAGTANRTVVTNASLAVYTDGTNWLLA